MSKWPADIKDEDLQSVTNENDDFSGPIYRLFTDVDVREVEPETEYSSTRPLLIFSIPSFPCF